MTLWLPSRVVSPRDQSPAGGSSFTTVAPAWASSMPQ
jgi:hypothetical protein